MSPLRSGFAVVPAMTVLLTLAAAPGRVHAQELAKNVQQALKSAVEGTKPKLGTLEPWKAKLFEDEVVPQYTRFIRDYRPSASGNLVVDVDQDAIQKYLSFYAPSALNIKKPKILVYLRGDKTCAKCAAAESAMKRLTRNRLSHRGFVIDWYVPDHAAELATGKDLDHALTAAAQAQGDAGAAVVQWHPVPVDENEDPHYQVQGYVVAWRDSQELKADSSMQLLDSQSFESIAARVLTDVIIDISVQAQSSGASVAGATSPVSDEEVRLTLNGFKDFKQYARLKSQLTTALQGAGALEEESIARGQAVFGVKTDKPADQVKALLEKASVDPDHLKVTATGGQMIQAEIVQ